MSPALAQSARADNVVEEVVVTGSRVVQNGYQTPTPVTVATTEQLTKAAPTSLSDALNQLPQFMNSQTAKSDVQGRNNVFHGNSLNLRNLGAIRTLILQDGRRVPASRFQGIVDVNQIPDMLVKRVEVVTGGASAVYGSDAVAGVVNYILDTDFTGVKVIAQGGISTVRDAPSYRLGAAYGTSLLGDRFKVLLSAAHSQSDMVYRDQRDPNNYARDNWAFVADSTKPSPGTASNPLFLSPNVVGTTSNDFGRITNGPPGFTTLAVSRDGRTVTPWDFGRATGFGNQIGGSGGNQIAHQGVIAGINLDQLFGQASYDFNSDWKATANVSWVKSGYHLNGGASNVSNVPIFSGNPYLPAALQAAMTANNTAQVTYSRRQSEVSPALQQEFTKAWTTTLALSGTVFGNWKLDAYYSHGSADSNYRYDSNINLQRAYAAIDAVVVTAANVGATGLPIGSIQCRVALTNPGLYPGCAPYNPFGFNSGSAEARAYIFQTSRYWVNVDTDDVSAYLSGDLFSTWAGPIAFSAGATYRTSSLDVTSNSDPSRPVSVTGIRGAPATLTPFLQVNQSFTSGSDNVKEVSGELVVPLLKDFVVAKSLDLSLAGRRTDYKTSGSVSTWKVGLSYRPIEDLRLRATLSRDIRAPSLFELFGGRTSQSTTTPDPHTNVTTFTQLISGGNLTLTPETGKTKALGVIYQPAWAPGFGFSVDYYDIRITNAIGSPTAANILRDCEQSNGASTACDLVARPLPFSNRTPANYPTSIQQVPLNTAFLANRGVDMEASYRTDLDDLGDSLRGSLALRAVLTYVDRYATQTDRAAPVRELDGTTDGQQPKYQGLFSAGYTIDGLTLYGQLRYLGKLRAGPSQVYAPGNDIPAFRYVDVTASYKTQLAGSETEFFLTVNNLFNKDWPLFPLTAPGSNAPTLYTVYDIMGRYFTAGVRARF